MRKTAPPETHAIYLDQDQVGNPRISVTMARQGRRVGGKRIRSLTRQRQGRGLPTPVDDPVEPSREAVTNCSPGPPAGGVPPQSPR